MATRAELEKMAEELQLMAMAYRRFNRIGDEEGIDLMSRFFKRIEKVAGPELVKNVWDSIAGCGIGLSSQTLEEVKQRVRNELASHELPEFDPKQCLCSAIRMPPCSYCENGQYKMP
jgi:hypothetical protein